MPDKGMETAQLTLWIALNCIIILVIVFCAVIGNGFVLIVYRRDKKLSGSVYIITLAVIDLLACCILLPQTPLYVVAENNDFMIGVEVIIVEATLVTLATVFTQATMSVDQFLAVFYPFKHSQLRKRLNMSMFVTFLAVFVVSQLLRYVLPAFVVDQDAYFVYMTFAGCMLILLTIYPAVAMKLYKQGHTVRPGASHSSKARAITSRIEANSSLGPSANARTSQLADATQTQTKLILSKRAMHIQALKIYAAIFLVFVFAYVVAISAETFNSPWLGYAYYSINHTANPIIYYCFVEKFRNSVKEYWKRIW